MTLFDFEDLKTEEIKIMSMTAAAIDGVERIPVQLDVYVSNFWAGALQNMSDDILVGDPKHIAWRPTLLLAMPLSVFSSDIQANVRRVYTVNGRELETSGTVYTQTWYPLSSVGYRALFPSVTSNEFSRGGFRWGEIDIMATDTAGRKYITFPYYDETNESWSWDTDEVYRIPFTEENVGLYDNANSISISVYGSDRFVAEDKFFHNIGVPYAQGLVVNNDAYYPEINAQGEGWETKTGWRMQTGVPDLSQPSLRWFNLLRAVTGENGGIDFPYAPSDLYVAWTVFLDGTKKPLIAINGNSPVIGENGISPDKVYMELRMYKNLDDFPNNLTVNDPQFTEELADAYSILKLPFNTSYGELLSIVDPNLWDMIVAGIYQFIPNMNRIALCMRAVTYEGEVAEKVTDWCFIQIPSMLPEDSSKVFCANMQGNDASTIRVVYGYPTEEDDSYPDDMGTGTDSTDPSDTIGSSEGYAAHSLLTTTYAMTPARLQQIGRVLWSDGFMDNIQLVNNSPIENIVSVKMFPFPISGTDENIMLGNVSTGVNGAKVSNDYSYKKTIGSMSVTKKYHSFLDYAPFTKLTIFLPFIGYKELDTNVYMGKTLKVEYITDLVTGACKAILYADNVPVDDFEGSMGIDIPITGSNRAQVEAGYIMSAVGGGMQLASGNISGAIGTALNGALNKYTSSTKGNASPSCNAYQTRNVFLVYDRPSWQDLGAFNHTKGRMCNQSKLLNNLTGYTVTSADVDLSGIVCTDTEREEIRSLLSGGVFL